MSKRKRRDVDIFNMSFLDVVSCGFGAIILLLVIIQVSEPRVIQQLAVDLTGLVERLELEIYRIRGETTVLNRDLTEKQEQLSLHRTKLARLKGDLSKIRGEHHATKNDFETQSIIENQLAIAKQSLSEEVRRLNANSNTRRPPDSSIGGVPVDSEYIMFIIDTSGSMGQGAWSLVLKKVKEILQIYPSVKGIQVMNDMGDYMYTQYKGQWIPDTPARREAIIRRLSGWFPFSNSSPVEGIQAAIRRFHTKDKKISLYVLGDDFASGSIQTVIDTVERLNRADSSGNKRVRIHTVGFPVQFGGNRLSYNAVRYAALMRKLAEDNGGSFVGLNSVRP
jgi:hypothetical protein